MAIRLVDRLAALVGQQSGAILKHVHVELSDALYGAAVRDAPDRVLLGLAGDTKIANGYRVPEALNASHLLPLRELVRLGRDRVRAIDRAVVNLQGEREQLQALLNVEPG